GIGHVYFFAGKYFAMVDKRSCWLLRHSDTDTRIRVAPGRVSIVEVVFSIHNVDIGCPYTAGLFPVGLLFECLPHHLPVYQVCRPQNGYKPAPLPVAPIILGAIGIKESRFRITDDGRIRKDGFENRVGIPSLGCIRLLDTIATVLLTGAYAP